VSQNNAKWISDVIKDEKQQTYIVPYTFTKLDGMFSLKLKACGIVPLEASPKSKQELTVNDEFAKHVSSCIIFLVLFSWMSPAACGPWAGACAPYGLPVHNIYYDGHQSNL